MSRHVNPINRSRGSLPEERGRGSHRGSNWSDARSVSCVVVVPRTTDRAGAGRAGPSSSAGYRGRKRAAPEGSHPRGEAARRLRAFSGYPGSLGGRSAAPAGHLPHRQNERMTGERPVDYLGSGRCTVVSDATFFQPARRRATIGPNRDPIPEEGTRR